MKSPSKIPPGGKRSLYAIEKARIEYHQQKKP